MTGNHYLSPWPLIAVVLFILPLDVHGQAESDDANQKLTSLSSSDREIFRQVERELDRRSRQLPFVARYRHIATNPIGSFVGRGILGALMFQSAREARVEWLLGEDVIKPLDALGFRPTELMLLPSTEIELIFIRLRFAKKDLPAAEWASKPGIVDNADVRSRFLRHSDNAKIVLIRELNTDPMADSTANVVIIGRLTSDEAHPDQVIALNTFMLRDVNVAVGQKWVENEAGWKSLRTP